METTDSNDDPGRTLPCIVDMVGFLCGMGGVGVVVYQALLWLKRGEWVPVSVFKVVAPFLPPSFINWIAFPTDWRGMNTIINILLDLPMSVVAIVLGVLLGFLGSVIDYGVQKRRCKGAME
jgi:hypothetical protein